MNPQGQKSVQHDRIYRAFLAAQFETAMTFAATTDFITLVPVEGVPPCRYIARFTCTGLVQHEGQVMQWEDFVVGFYFPHDYIIRSGDRLHIVGPLEGVRMLTA